MIGTELYVLLQKRLKCGTKGRMYGKNTCEIDNLEKQIVEYLKSNEAKELLEGELTEITDSVFKDNTGRKIIPDFINQVNELKPKITNLNRVKQIDLKKHFELTKIIKLLEERNNNLQKKIYRVDDIKDNFLDPLILTSIIAYTKLYISNNKTTDEYIRSFLDNNDADIDINKDLTQIKELIKKIAKLYNKVLEDFNDDTHHYEYVPPLYNLVEKAEATQPNNELLALNKYEATTQAPQLDLSQTPTLTELQKIAYNFINSKGLYDDYMAFNKEKPETGQIFTYIKIKYPNLYQSRDEILPTEWDEYRDAERAKLQPPEISGGKIQRTKSKRNKSKRNKSRRKQSKRRK